MVSNGTIRSILVGGLICGLLLVSASLSAGADAPLRSMKYTSRPQADAAAWQQDVRARLWPLLKLDDLVANRAAIALNPAQLSSEKKDRYELQEIEINSTPTRRIKVLVAQAGGGRHASSRRRLHPRPRRQPADRARGGLVVPRLCGGAGRTRLRHDCRGRGAAHGVRGGSDADGRTAVGPDALCGLPGIPAGGRPNRGSAAAGCPWAARWPCGWAGWTRGSRPRPVAGF